MDRRDVLYYDRKEDEDLGRKDIEEMFSSGWVTDEEFTFDAFNEEIWR